MIENQVNWPPRVLNFVIASKVVKITQLVIHTLKLVTKSKV